MTAITVNVRPLADRVLVKALTEVEDKVGSIIIPDSAKEKPQEGEIVAIGTGRLTDDGNRVSLDLSVGDRILYGKYSGTEVRLEGDDYLIMREADVLAVVGA